MNIGIMIVVVIAAIWALGILIGMIGGLPKNPHTPTAIDSSAVQDKEQQTIDDTEAKRQKLMDDMKQKMEDAGQKF